VSFAGTAATSTPTPPGLTAAVIGLQTVNVNVTVDDVLTDDR
jgi:hypothetical protein